jgi:two-component system, OmpR family, sensor histidine kinase PrrB
MRSLRGRLTLGVTLLLAAVLLTAGELVARYVDRSERRALDDRLQRTAELSRATALAAVEQQLPDNDRRLDAVLTATGTSLRLLVGHTVLLDTGQAPPSHPPPGTGLRTFTADGVRYRGYTTTLRDPSLGGLARLQVTTRLASVERRQRALERRLAALGLLVLVVAGAGVFLAAEVILRPLRRLRAATASIAGDEDLARRVAADDGPRETRALAGSFNAMLARLGRSAADRERALAATRRFAADAGHELRTPLTSVQATLSALSRHPELDAARRAAMLDGALREHDRLVRLLDGLQALARGDAAPLDAGPVDLGELVDGAAEAVAARHPGLALETEAPAGPVAVTGWEPGLRILVENLIENAARHGRPGGQVRVGLAAARDGAGPRLVVDDDGPGVAATDRGRIFEPFARLDGAGGVGSGLGLALVAQQARHHGAEVEVGDSPLGGARFAVAFPA